MSVKRPISHAHKLEIERRRQQVLEMAIAGATVRQISVRLRETGTPGASLAIVSTDIRRALGALAKANREGADRMREMLNLRYDRLLLRLWPRAMGRPRTEDAEEVPPDMGAVDRVLRVLSDVRAVNGLDRAPGSGPDRPLWLSQGMSLVEAFRQVQAQRPFVDVPALPSSTPGGPDGDDENHSFSPGSGDEIPASSTGPEA